MHRCFSTIGAVLLLSFAVLLGAQARSPFQAVSIEPSTGGLIDIRFSSNGLIARTTTLAELIEHAHGVKAWQIFGGPDWVRVDRFTVRATTAEPVDRDQMQLLLQTLLAERFRLQLVREAQTVTLYRLTKANVRNLKPAGPTDRPIINVREVDNAGYRWEARRATMVDLAAALSQHLHAAVLDDTNLIGTFNFRLDFSQDDVFGNIESDPGDGPTIFSALDEQLGLKLVPDKGLVHGYVIRRVSKPSPDR